LNYNKALMELNERIKTKNIFLDIKGLEKIQKIVTEGLIEKYRWGRIRKEPVFVNDPRTDKTIYWPPEHKEVIPLIP